jgi:hypothetical protein
MTLAPYRVKIAPKARGLNDSVATQERIDYADCVRLKRQPPLREDT